MVLTITNSKSRGNCKEKKKERGREKEKDKEKGKLPTKDHLQASECSTAVQNRTHN